MSIVDDYIMILKVMCCSKVNFAPFGGQNPHHVSECECDCVSVRVFVF